MKIKMKILALMMIVVMALTGCVGMETKVIIRQDGSAKGIITVSIDKAAVNAELKKQGASDAEIQQFWTGYKQELNADAGVTFQEVTRDGKEYIETYEITNFSKGSLGKKLGFNKNSYVTADTLYGTIDLSGTDDEEVFQELSAMGGDISAVTLTFVVEMPKDIAGTNGTISETNKKQVTFQMKVNGKTTMYATTVPGQTISDVKAKVAKANKVKKAKIKKLKAKKAAKNSKKRTVVLKIGKVSQAVKYEVQYGTKKNFKGAKTKKIKKTSYTIKNLKKNTKYYVRVRAIKKNLAGYDVSSAWTKKSVKTKK